MPSPPAPPSADACVYNAVLDALLGSGLVSAQAKAAQLAAAAHRQGHLRLTALSAYDSSATAYTPGAALMVVLRWLAELRWVGGFWDSGFTPQRMGRLPLWGARGGGPAGEAPEARLGLAVVARCHSAGAVFWHLLD